MILGKSSHSSVSPSLGCNVDLMLEWLESNALKLPLTQYCLTGEQRNKGLVGPGWPQQVTFAL